MIPIRRIINIEVIYFNIEIFNLLIETCLKFSIIIEIKNNILKSYLKDRKKLKFIKEKFYTQIKFEIKISNFKLQPNH